MTPYRVAAGIVGLLFVGARLLARRRRPFAPLPPPVLLPAIGAAVFTIAALALAVQGSSALLTTGGAGAGQWLSGAIAAGMVALWFASSLLTALASWPETIIPS